jgi:hypothetical protein
MANFTWANPAGGDWGTDTNWNPVGIPGNGANIMLPTLAGAYTSTDNLSFIDDINLSIGNSVTLIIAEGDTGVENIMHSAPARSSRRKGPRSYPSATV